MKRTATTGNWRNTAIGFRPPVSLAWLGFVWLLVTLFAISYLFVNDLYRSSRYFNEVNDRLLLHVSDRTLVSETTLEGFAAFIRTQDVLDHDRARGYARQLLERYPFLYMLEIVERVPDALRAHRERELTGGYDTFEIRDFDFDSDRSWRRATTRPAYYPIVFQEPLLPGANVLGLDIANHPMLRNTLLAAARQPRPVATPPLQLVEGQVGYALYRAIDPTGADPAVGDLGADRFVLLALQAEVLFAALVEAPSNLSISIHHAAYAHGEPRGQLLSRPADHSPAAFTRAVLPRFSHASMLESGSQPLVLRVEWQMVWADLSLREAIIAACLSLSLFLIVRYSMYDYFRREILALEQQGHLYEMANFDALTGLANRVRLLDELEATLARASHSGDKAGILFIDVDEFSQVNNRHGHTVGDAVLVEVAARLERYLPEGDTLGRYGGDEFLLVCSHVQSTDALRFLVRRLKRELNTPIIVSAQRFDIAINIGIAIYPDDGRNAQALINAADRAMYQDKERV